MNTVLSTHATKAEALKELNVWKSRLEPDGADYARECGIEAGSRWTILERSMGNVEAELIDSLGGGDRYWIEFNADDTFSLFHSFS